jgi:hypothetical protein
MAPADGETMNQLSETSLSESTEAQLSQVFGGYRAEWLKEHIFDLFTEPSYFPELKYARPCVLIGGRGTAKTTVLRGLSYEGQFALSGRNPQEIGGWNFYGIYYRVNTNRVTAFRGSEVSEDRWIQLFAHYFNLLLCDGLLRFLSWYEEQTGSRVRFDDHSLEQFSTSLHIPIATTVSELTSRLTSSRIAFESGINNIVDHALPPLSLQALPVDILVGALETLPIFGGKHFYFLIDEFENFEPYQQQVVNTFIKHAGQSYTFKVGVRDLGIRRKTTLNPNEQLISPADYVRIDISEKLSGEHFERFALKVCNDRIRRLKSTNPGVIDDIQVLLPRLSEDDEAEMLGIEESSGPQRASLSISRPDQASVINDLSKLQIYFLATWAKERTQALPDVYDQFAANRSEWDVRYGNYKHSLLFSLKKGKSGIRRYYSGWDVFTLMAASNIRYLLELVDQSILLHVRRGNTLAVPLSHSDQTLAAQAVGKKNLLELEGLSVYGAQLTKLLLGLGRVFGQMAADPLGHAPEVNQFHLADFTSDKDALREEESKALRLLESAVMHLALLRWPGNKLGAETATKDYDYAIHPIFSAFFVFSYRKKRKMILSAVDLLGFIEQSPRTIREVLARSNRDSDPLPEQLEIFHTFYASTE